MRKELILLLIFGAIFASCAEKPAPRVIKTELVAVVPAEGADTSEFARWLEPYKQTMMNQMSVPIGYAEESMDRSLPESLLGNLLLDIFGSYAKSEGYAYDCIITNIGGIRDSLQKGEITIGDIYSIVPFDNTLVLLDLDGKSMEELCQAIAKEGGQVTSGIRMTIVDKKYAENIKVNNAPIDTLRTYKVLTNDYLSFGNDRLYPLANHTKQHSFGLPLRDVVIDYIRQQTRNKKTIKSELCGEVIVKQTSSSER